MKDMVVLLLSGLSDLVMKTWKRLRHSMSPLLLSLLAKGALRPPNSQ